MKEIDSKRVTLNHKHPIMNTSDTICAICTASGRGAIAVLRLSGAEAIRIADSLFRGHLRLADSAPRTLHYGTIVDTQGVMVDDVVVSTFHAPHSYTGDDVVEISCHGSTLVQRRILQLLIEAGARMAQPGEFTKRAFVNGKMDLSQAEAVGDMIAAESESARRVAFSQMRGGISKELKSLREKLIHFASLIELELDFSEEDVEFADRSELTSLTDEILGVVTRLADSFRLGNAIKEGVRTAIVGAPNAGKSTILNALLNEERAIVSDIEGTTRDTVEETLWIDGVAFRLIDTAGIRDTNDKVEAEGVRRSREAISKARVVVAVIDASLGRERAEHEAVDIHAMMNADQMLVVALNKVDACGGSLPWVDEAWRRAAGASRVVLMSAKEGKGIDELKNGMMEAVGGGEVGVDDVLVSNVRHYEALLSAREALLRVRAGIDLGSGGEILSMDLREVTEALGSITGEVATEDVLENIFKHFCIGK